MYFVDRGKIEELLSYIDELLETYSQHSYDSPINKLGLERITHMLIESVMDVGNMMIDGFIMRDPGSYEDIVDILIDEKVLPEEDEDDYKKVIRLRDMLVKNYIAIDHHLLNQLLSESEQKLFRFSSYIKSYLDNELGVAHAFSND